VFSAERPKKWWIWSLDYFVLQVSEGRPEILAMELGAPCTNDSRTSLEIN
jgi:hypothetical protein